MDLLTRINSLPLLRQHGIPTCLQRVCLIAIAEDLERIPIFHQAHPWLSIEHIVLIDDRPGGQLEYQAAEKAWTVPVGDLTSLLELCHLEKIILNPKHDHYAQIPEAVCRLLAQAGIRNFFVHCQDRIQVISKRRDANFLHNNLQALNTAYSLLADEASREVFAARAKAVMTGDPSYLPIAGHAEYFHPLVRPEAGDVLIDGGISDNVNVQTKFAEAVGPNGTIYGFEPIPDMFAIARHKLSAWPRYRINCAGLGQNKGKTRFEPLGDSSHISDQLRNTIECDLVGIDEFAEENQLEKIDAIKLDIEGAELQALIGARKIIKRFKPKLIICLYHKNQDLFELPVFIKRLVPQYDLYLAHSSYHFIDTILYAKVPDQA